MYHNNRNHPWDAHMQQLASSPCSSQPEKSPRTAEWPSAARNKFKKLKSIRCTIQKTRGLPVTVQRTSCEGSKDGHVLSLSMSPSFVTHSGTDHILCNITHKGWATQDHLIWNTACRYVSYLVTHLLYLVKFLNQSGWYCGYLSTWSGKSIQIWCEPRNLSVGGGERMVR